MRLGVRGNYVWYFVIFVVFMGFGIWRSREVGDALKSPFGVAMQATSERGDNFNGKEVPTI